MVTTGRRLAVLVAVLVVSAAGLSACADSPPVPSPASAGPPSPSVDPDVTRLEQLAPAAHDRTPAELAQLPRLQQARLLAPCAELSWGGFYCVGLGFTDDRPDHAALLASASAPAAVAGDLPFPSWLRHRVAMPLEERLAEQGAEVDGAILGLDKARSLAE